MRPERQEKAPARQQITPERILADNQSEAATTKINEWLDARGRGRLLLASGCGDARVNIPLFTQSSEVVEKKSIAGAGQQDSFQYLLTHPGNNAILAWQHFNKYEVGDDGIFRGCGGIGAKRDSMLGGGIGLDEEGVSAFVRDDIHGTHVISQGYRVALEKSLILEKSGILDKPVIGAAVDHSSGRIIPFVLLEQGGKVMHVAFNLAHLFDEMDCPHLYEDGKIPELDHGLLPLNIQDLLERNKKFVEETGGTIEFSDMQSVHNPSAVFITTSIVPVSIRYPEVFGMPNTAFTLGLPYKKMGDEEVQVTPTDLHRVMRQAHYPLAKATDAEKEGDAFFNTNLLVIESKSMEMSQEIARVANTHPWIQDWRDKKRSRILIASSDEGMTQNILDITDQLVA